MAAAHAKSAPTTPPPAKRQATVLSILWARRRATCSPATWSAYNGSMHARTLVVLVAGGAWLGALAGSASPLSCGSRTELIVVPPADGGAEAQVDAAADSVADAPLDSTPDTAPDSAVDAPEEPMPCTAATDCTSTTYCAPTPTCDPMMGCVYLPRNCDDGIDCTDDACNEQAMQCTHTADDSKCPDTELCSPLRACYPFVYSMASDGNLYEVAVPSGELVEVGSPGADPFDVALTSDSTLYATDSYVLYTLDRATGASTAVASILPLNMYDGLGSFPPDTLYAAADVPEIFQIDPMGGTSTMIAPLPSGYRSSGDLTTLAGVLYLTLASTAAGSTTGSLATVDLSALTTTVIGDTGFACVYGLGTLGTTIYGLTCQGAVLTIDPTSGQATMVGMANAAFLGAAGR
jgi:hypothetical protein